MKAKIIPTHIYFHDLYGADVFIYIIKKFLHNDIKNVTIYTSSYLYHLLYFNNIDLLKNILFDFVERSKALLIYLLRFGNSPVYKYKLKEILSFIK